MATLEQDREVLIKALGYVDYIDFQRKTGTNLRVITGYSSHPNNFRNIHITFTDYFFASYTNPGIFSVNDFNNPKAEEVGLFNKRLKYKNRQISKIASIKFKAVADIKAFIHEHFSIGVDRIKDSDIEFIEYSQFRVAGSEHRFSYQGVLSGDSFDINTYYYHPFKDGTALVANMMKHYYGVDILKLKDKNNDT